MAHTLAFELSKYKIRVNSVSPGLVKTAMTYWVPQQPDWETQLKYYGGFPRLVEVKGIGSAYVYLLNDAATCTTSTDIKVNGVVGSKFFSFQTRFRVYPPFMSFASIFGSQANQMSFYYSLLSTRLVEG